MISRVTLCKGIRSITMSKQHQTIQNGPDEAPVKPDRPEIRQTADAVLNSGGKDAIQLILLPFRAEATYKKSGYDQPGNFHINHFFGISISYGFFSKLDILNIITRQIKSYNLLSV